MSRTLATLFAVALLGMSQGAGADETASSTDWKAVVQTAAAAAPMLQSLAPSDIAAFCPQYARLSGADRSAFWGNLLVGVAEAESGGDLTRTRWRAFDGAIHRPAFRRGLFQISIEAAHGRRYQCAVGIGAELTDAAVNASCAVNILAAEVAGAGAVSGAGHYWPSLADDAQRRALATQTASQSPCNAKDAQP